MITWTREEIKSKAKQTLQGIYWKVFFVSILLTVAKGIMSIDSAQLGQIISQDIAYRVLCLLLIFKITVVYPLEIGSIKYFIQACNRGELTFSSIKEGFTEKYLNKVSILIIRDISITLWSFLFVIPGVIKSFEYIFIPHILAENPSTDWKTASRISKNMTEGHKFDIWVLQLSFMGWYLLGILALGVGVVFVEPYFNITTAELYIKLKNKEK